MNRVFFSIFTISFIIAMVACSPDSNSSGPRVNDDGLTRDITQLVPDSVLTILDSLGMPLNGGNNPPNIEGYFLASPLIMLNTNRTNDFPIGTQFADYYIRLYDQSNSKLTVSMDYQNGGEAGSGLGSYIVGESNDFSVFAELNSTYLGNEATLLAMVSGTMTDQGISNFYYALIMLDNNGNPNGVWIENAEGRIFYDSDGSSPIVEGTGKTSGKNTKTAATK